MLQGATSSSHATPALFCPSARAQPGAWRPEVRLKDTAATFPFVGSTSSEAEHMSQRHTHRGTHRGHGHGWSQRQPQTRHCSQQHPHSGLTADTGTDSHILFSSWADRGRMSPVQHTPHTLQVHKHMHICGSHKHKHDASAHSIYPPRSCHPLSTPRVLDSMAGPAGCSLPTRSTHTLVPQESHIRGSPSVPAQTLCPPDTPARTWALLLPGWLGSKVDSKPTCTPHTHPAWGRYTLPQQPAPSAQAGTHSPDPDAGAKPVTLLTDARPSPSSWH